MKNIAEVFDFHKKCPVCFSEHKKYLSIRYKYDIYIKYVVKNNYITLLMETEDKLYTANINTISNKMHFGVESFDKLSGGDYDI